MVAASDLRWVQAEEPTTQYEQVDPPPPQAVAPNGWRSVCLLMLVAGLVLWLAPSQMTDAPELVRSDAVSLAETSASLERSARDDLSTAVPLQTAVQTAVQTTVPLQTAVHEKAHIIIVRHGEKGAKDARTGQRGQGLSDVGQKRAQYLARCMSQATPTPP